MDAAAGGLAGRTSRMAARVAGWLRGGAARPRVRLIAATGLLAAVLFAAGASTAWIETRAAARATAAAAAARATAQLERAARAGAEALLRADADAAPVDDAAVDALLAGLRRGVADGLAREAQEARLPPGEIEALAGLAAELARIATARAPAGSPLVAPLDDLPAAAVAAPVGAPAAVPAGAAGRALADALSAQAAALARTADALAALARPARGLPASVWLGAGGLATAALAALLARRPRAAAAAPTAEAGGEESRARFLAMMHHELRTPMNGVVGLIALLRERVTAPEERRMLDEAERAGRQIAAMLEDMLEQEAPAPADAGAGESFRVEAIADSVRDLFGPAAARAGVDFRVACVGPLPPRAGGDGRRLLRALSHLCGYVLDKAGARDVTLDLEHDGAECRARLSFDFAGGAAEALKLRELVETGAKSAEEMTESGLGPLLAKGLLERMGGRLEVSTIEGGRVLVLAAAPSAALGAAAPRVRIVAQTRSLGAIGAAAATAAGVEVLAAEDAPAPDVVLLEAGGADERAALADARAAWPRAAVIALGDPGAPALFDAVIRPPLDPERVAAAVDAAWGRREGGRPAEPRAVATAS